MGIKQLMSLLQEKAPGCIKKVQLDMLTGRIVACDASMAMYQFLVITQGFNQNTGLTELTDKEGNRTAHLVGLLNRTIQFMENGIKPIWVFDGKAPELKRGEIAKRQKAKQEAQKKFEEAQESGDLEQALKHKVMNTTITSQMTADCKKMLRLMGCPVIEAPSEAEAQCASLVKLGKAYATATEDMDALTFGTEVLLRGFNSKKEPILEVNLQQMLKELELNYEEFIDLCILCGCDYSEPLEGIGPVTAYKLIKENKRLEDVVKKLEEDNKKGTKKRKWVIPEHFTYPEARELFKNPEVIQDFSNVSIKWEKPKEEEMTSFLCGDKGFAEQRVANAIKKLKNLDGKGMQSRLENFFGVAAKKTSNAGKGDEVKKETVKKTKTTSAVKTQK